MNKPIKELYENAPFPAATVDKNSYITWANARAKEKYPALFLRDGLRSLARFSDERELIGRLVKENVGATVRLRGTELAFTFTPLPEKGKEMLLTLSEGVKEPTDLGGGLLVSAVPALRDTLSRLCETAETPTDKRLPASVSGRFGSFRKELAALTGTTDHMALYAALENGLQPELRIGNTSHYFSELLAACCRLLGDKAPATSVHGHGWIVTDYPLAERLLLMLLANALEHGDGETSVTVETDGELRVAVKNRLRGEDNPFTPEEWKTAFVSFTADAPNDRLGIGLTLSHEIAERLGGKLELSVEDGVFVAAAVLPSAPVEEPTPLKMKREADYLADRYGAVYAELMRFTE